MTETEVRRTIAKALQSAQSWIRTVTWIPGSLSPAALPTSSSIPCLDRVDLGRMDQRETNLTGLPHELVAPASAGGARLPRMPFLPRIRNSTITVMLRWLLEDIYGFREELTPAGVERLSDLVARRGREKGWQDRLFDGICGIERCISVQRKPKVSNPRIESAREALGLVNLADGKRAPRAVLSELDKLLGREVKERVRFRRRIEEGPRRAADQRQRILEPGRSPTLRHCMRTRGR